MSVFTNLAARALAVANTPTKTGVTAAEVAADITKIGGPIIAVISALAGTGTVSIPGSWLGVIDALVAVLTAFASVNKQQAVSAAKAAVKLRAARKATRKSDSGSVVAALPVFVGLVFASLCAWTWLLMVCVGAAGLDWGFWHTMWPFGLLATIVLGGAQARLVKATK